MAQPTARPMPQQVAQPMAQQMAQQMVGVRRTVTGPDPLPPRVPPPPLTGGPHEGARPTHRAPWSEIDASVGDVLRPGVMAAAEAMIETISTEVGEYARPLEGEFGRMVREGVTVALTTFLDLLGSDDPGPALGVYEALGRVELREGRTLDALQSAYRVGARSAWQRVVEAGEAAGLGSAVLYRLAEAIFAYIDLLSAASVRGYAQEQSAQAGAAQARRHAFIALLARRPAPETAQIERAALDAAWPLPATLAAIAVGDHDPVGVARRMLPGSIGAALDPVGIVLVPDAGGPGRPAQIATALGRVRAVVGPTVAWQEAPRSVFRAASAWPLHARGLLGRDDVANAEEHLLDLVLAADPELLRDLVERRLRPLRRLTEASRPRAEATLRAWLAANGDVSEAARSLAVHAQTVRYRLAGLRDLFGEALDQPATRLELALALRAVDLLAPPDPD